MFKQELWILEEVSKTNIKIKDKPNIGISPYHFPNAKKGDIWKVYVDYDGKFPQGQIDFEDKKPMKVGYIENE